MRALPRLIGISHRKLVLRWEQFVDHEVEVGSGSLICSEQAIEEQCDPRTSRSEVRTLSPGLLTREGYPFCTFYRKQEDAFGGLP